MASPEDANAQPAGPPMLVPLYERFVRTSTDRSGIVCACCSTSLYQSHRQREQDNSSIRNAIIGVGPVLPNFCNWLSNTPISLKIQTVLWIIPAVQTVHILCVSIVISTMAMLDLRLLGVTGRSQPVSSAVSRWVPWVWGTLPVMLLTGCILIVGEPTRELMNPYFRAKMAMLAAVVVITLIVHLRSKDAAYWESRSIAAKFAGSVSLLLWVAIIAAGRWIAYY